MVLAQDPHSEVGVVMDLDPAGIQNMLNTAQAMNDALCSRLEILERMTGVEDLFHYLDEAQGNLSAFIEEVEKAKEALAS